MTTTTLASADRKQLETATLKARDLAEAAVAKRFQVLALTSSVAPASLPNEDRAGRNALRARARSIGKGRVDAALDNLGAIEAGIPFLTEELAYDVWHRLLFARFLAENGLLVHRELGQLSVDDLTALAADEGIDPWDLAAEIASERLPGLFSSDVLRLAPEDRLALRQVLLAIPAPLFHASDALGWVYQFWQAKRKGEINAAGKKIGGADLSPVTQLFTEDYMVDFLLQNSLGAWFIARYPDSPLRAEMPYLRFREDGTPAAGTFPTWPETLAEITVLDPCCGSGHFLVGAFHLLTRMRAEVEGLSLAEAADAVLRDNLFGLELDARCTQIAIFAVALEAWKLGGHPEVHLPQIACSGLPVAGQKAEWARLAGNDDTLRTILENLYDLFAQAPELGSLIDPKRAVQIGGSAKVRGTTAAKRAAPERQTPMVLPHEWDRVAERVSIALAKTSAGDDTTAIFARHDLEGTVRAADLLSRTYTLVATNVPFLSRGNHDATLRAFAENQYPEAKNDLATMFFMRLLSILEPGGALAGVSPYNWYFLGAYKQMRKVLLETVSFEIVSNLGFKSFRTPMWDFNIGLTVITNTAPSIDHTFAGLDASEAKGPGEKDALLRDGDFTLVGQQAQLGNPDQRIATSVTQVGRLLEEIAHGLHGMGTKDAPRFIAKHWEVPRIGEDWEKLQSTVESVVPYGGAEDAIYWQKDQGILHERGKRGEAILAGRAALGKPGVIVSQMRDLASTIYLRGLFDKNVAAIIPKNPEHLPAIWAFCSSPEFNIAVRKIDSKLNVTNATLVKVPFDLEYWQKVADEQYPNGLPEPYSSDPTQWLFDGTIPGSDNPLHVAVARLLGYAWPDQTAEETERLAPYADPDGIVALPSVNQELPAHDRLRALLQAAYGDAWTDATLGTLLAQVEASSLEEWLRGKKGFFAQHVKLFHNRPFIWQITDGLKDGFSVLVNYHKLDRAMLNKLIYTYLSDWIGRQERDAANGVAGAPAKLEAATTLRGKLVAIAAGEPPYDVYVRWKSLAEQPVGWNPDLNDGVRLNIRPFIEAGIFPAKVTVNWNKDRGNDPAVRVEPLAEHTKPDETDLRKRIAAHCSTDRLNDLHFSTVEKERARELAAE